MIQIQDNSIREKCGVYGIRNTINGKRYVGSTSRSFGERCSKHISDLLKNRHHSNRLQNAWNKYGQNAFVFDVLEVTNPEHAVAVEQTLIDYYQSYDATRGYNIAPTAGSTRGIPRRRGIVFTAEHRKRLSIAGRGRKLPVESLSRMSAAQKSKDPASDVTRRRISDKMKGRIFTETHKARLSQAGMNRQVSQASRDKMSIARRSNSKSRTIVIDGKEINTTEASEKYSVNYYTMMSRLYKGWSDYEAVFGRVK